MTKFDCIGPLTRAGITHDDAQALRRISMTLHRWHELECGDGNNYASWCITRGRKGVDGFEYDEDGKPFIERHTYANPETRTRYEPIPDRETGARKRLAKIMGKYPTLQAFIQGDPRGAALYILRPGDVPNGADVGSYYSRGLAVYK